MKKEDIEKNVGTYRQAVIALEKIEDRIIEILDFYKSNHPEFFAAEDFRPGTFGRLLSAINSSKFFFHSTMKYVETTEWDKDYLNNVLPKKYPSRDYLGHFIDIDMGLRFHLFHAVYHQIETTYRIVHELLKLSSGKPVEVVTKKFALYDENFIKLFDAIRNTIHNNGFYMPIGKQEKEVSVTFKGDQYYFKQNTPVKITTKSIIEIIQAAIELMYNVLQKEEIESIPSTKDRTD